MSSTHYLQLWYTVEVYTVVTTQRMLILQMTSGTTQVIHTFQNV